MLGAHPPDESIPRMGTRIEFGLFQVADIQPRPGCDKVAAPPRGGRGRGWGSSFHRGARRPPWWRGGTGDGWLFPHEARTVARRRGDALGGTRAPVDAGGRPGRHIRRLSVWRVTDAV